MDSYADVVEFEEILLQVAHIIFSAASKIPGFLLRTAVFQSCLGSRQHILVKTIQGKE